MRMYNVSWEIEVEAENPVDAARRALEIQRLKESIATVFTVTESESQVRVDLQMEGDTHNETKEKGQ